MRIQSLPRRTLITNQNYLTFVASFEQPRKNRHRSSDISIGSRFLKKSIRSAVCRYLYTPQTRDAAGTNRESGEREPESPAASPLYSLWNAAAAVRYIYLYERERAHIHERRRCTASITRLVCYFLAPSSFSYISYRYR